MCGINGIYNLSLAGDYHSNIISMNKTLRHRGPDSTGVFYDQGIALGHQRLAIIDLSEAGKQPMFSYDQGYVLIFNGEIYNFQEIKKELIDYPFKSLSDTEVIIASYIKWGEDCIKRFKGAFAFAIWDKIDKKLFLARDRLGEKPLYYYFDSRVFVFSSEIRALCSSGLFDKRLSLDSLSDFLSYQTVHYPHTILKDVKMLEPAHCLSFKSGNIVIKNYWDPKNINSKTKDYNYNEIKENIFSLLDRSVKLQTISDVPFGAFLSGGIDSSIIVALMSKHLSIPVKTFSIIFNESAYNEKYYADLIVKRYNTNHTELNLSAKTFLKEVPHALMAMDHPSGDGPNTYVVSKLTREAGVTMALSGLGGDEYFSGYQVVRSLRSLIQKYNTGSYPYSMRLIISKLISIFSSEVKYKKLSSIFSLKELNFINSYPTVRRLFFPQELLEISSDFKENNSLKNILDNLIIDQKNLLDSQIALAEMFTYMNNILLRDSDQMSMANSLELRLPFLDYELIEFILAIPDQFKPIDKPKQLLIDSCIHLLPREIIQRKKMGFTFPWDQWIRTDLKDFCYSNIELATKRSFFNKKALNKLWDSFINNDPSITWAKIWNIVVIEHWLNANGISE